MDAKRQAQDAEAMDEPAAKTMRSTISKKFEDKANAAKLAKNPDFKPTQFISTTEKLNWVSKARTTPSPTSSYPMLKPRS